MRKKKLSCLDILRVDERSITGEVESLKLWFLRWTHSKKSELDDVAEDPGSVLNNGIQAENTMDPSRCAKSMDRN